MEGGVGAASVWGVGEAVLATAGASKASIATCVKAGSEQYRNPPMAQKVGRCSLAT